MKKINVIGLGYIGLPTALMFAKSGVEVVGTDLNEKLIDSLSKGKLTFEEEGLEELFKDAMEKGIKFTTEYQKTDTEIHILGVDDYFLTNSGLELADGRNFTGFDIVEVAPPYDHSEITAYMGANLAFEFMSILAYQKKKGMR